MAYAGTLTYKTELDTSGVKKSGSVVKSVIAGLGITKMISTAMSTITNSVDDAVKRVDTLNNFSKVMSNLGASAEESDKSIKLMSEKLTGLPTTLDQGARAVQRFTSANGDVKKSTDIFLALNNAILAGGASTDIQASAMEQLSQAYAKGKPDMMEWRTAMTAMPAQLKQVAKAMGYGSSDSLGEALRQGDVSMEEFMDTIAKLNTEGIDGFQSFEKQARNSTAGIGTAITVAKTQVVKGLADIITGIDKGLKKSGTSINKIISDLGKKAKELLDGIAKWLSKIDFKALFNILSKIAKVIPVVVSGFLAYKTTLVAIKGVNIVKNITSTVSALLKMTNPIGLAVAGITALTTAFIVFGNNATKISKKNQEINDSLKEYNDTMKTVQKAKDENLSKSMNEIYYYESLYDELKGIVDENGKVKEGYEDRASFITGKLSEALGIEIKMVDGVIKGYQGIQGEIDKTIEKKKAIAYYNAHEEEYNEALKEEAKRQKEVTEATTNRDNAEKKVNEEIQKAAKLYGVSKKEQEKLLQYYKGEISYQELTSKGWSKAAAEMRRYLEQSRSEPGSNRRKEIRDLQDTSKTLEKVTKAYANNQNAIDKYRRAEQELAEGHYENIQKIFNDTIIFNGKTKEANDKKYEEGKKGWEAYRQFLLDNQNKYSQEFLDSEQARIDAEIQKLDEERNKKNAELEQTNTDTINTTRKGLNDQLATIEGYNYEFRDAGNGLMQFYANGEAQGYPVTIEQAEKVTNDVIGKFKSGEYGAEEVGANITKGLEKGLSAGTLMLYRVAGEIGTNVLNAIKEAAEIASPSKATKRFGKFIDEGLQIGIKDGEKDTLKVANEFGNNVLDELSSSMNFNDVLDDMYKEMNNTIRMENSKLNFDVVSGNIYNKSFFQAPVQIDLKADVEMEKQKVGRLVTPSVVKTIKTGGGQL